MLKILQSFLCVLFVVLFSCKKPRIKILDTNNSASVEITPSVGRYGDTITVSGIDFDPVVQNNSVLINHTPAKIISVNDSALLVQVPACKGSGKVEFISRGKTITIGDFRYIPDIFIASNQYTNGIYKAQYWKNNTCTNLSEGTYSKEVIKIFVEKDDVYVLTKEEDGNGNEISYAYKLYKNEKLITIIPSTNDRTIRIYSLLVVGSDVYLGGTTFVSTVNSIGFRATYWKNATPYIISDKHSCIYGLDFYKNELYAVGVIVEKGIGTGCYWKNKEAVYMNNVETSVYMRDIQVVKGDVYTRGELYTGTDFRDVYWKNGDLQENAASMVKKIKAYNDDLYVLNVGYQNNSHYIVHSKNNTILQYIPEDKPSNIVGFDVFDNKFYTLRKSKQSYALFSAPYANYLLIDKSEKQVAIGSEAVDLFVR